MWLTYHSVKPIVQSFIDCDMHCIRKDVVVGIDEPTGDVKTWVCPGVVGGHPVLLV